jgi:hypothetical protein
MENLTIMQVFYREDITVPWFHEIIPEKYPNHAAYMKENYTESGKVTITKEISDDDSILIFYFNFEDEVSKAEFLNDAYLKTMIENRANYNKENNITNINE